MVNVVSGQAHRLLALFHELKPSGSRGAQLKGWRRSLGLGGSGNWSSETCLTALVVTRTVVRMTGQASNFLSAFLFFVVTHAPGQPAFSPSASHMHGSLVVGMCSDARRCSNDLE
jgi:hypothetical protein